MREIIEEYREKHSGLGLERFHFSGEGPVYQQLREFAQTPSLFSSKRLAVITGELAAAGDLGGFLQSLITKDDLICLISTTELPGADFNFLLKNPVLHQEFKELKGKQLAAFIKTEVKTRNIKLSPRLLNNLAEAHGADTWAIVTELDKWQLSNNQSRVELSSAPPANFQPVDNSFDLIRRLRARELGDRLGSLEILFKMEDPAKIFNLLAYQWGIEKKAMADYDVAVKSGKLDYETALVDLLLT